MKPKYEKPQAQLLNRTLAVSIGGCNPGLTPGTCGLPGYRAGTCDPTGSQEGVAPHCDPTGTYAFGGCSTGEWANF